jgi:NAD(P)-dependent dehydrogenase (short-subunit alcohol dehydrogenase family)
VLVDLQQTLAREVADGIRNRGGRALAVAADVADFAAIQRLVHETFQRTGRIDYMFNNAGIHIAGNAEQYAIEDWREMVDINLGGIIHGVQAVYGIMIDQGFGHIINTASMAGLIPFPGMAAYSATKHAIVGLSMSLRAEAALRGVRVSVLCPGFVRTDMLENGGKYGRALGGLSTEQEQAIEKMIMRCRPLRPIPFARKAIDQVSRNKSIIVVPARNRWAWRICRLFPAIGSLAGRIQYGKVQKLLDAGRKQ